MEVGNSTALSSFLYRIGRKDISDTIRSFETNNHLRKIQIDSIVYATLTDSSPELDDVASMSGALRPESGLQGEKRNVVVALLSSWTLCPNCGGFLSGALRFLGESRYTFSMSCERNHPDNVYAADLADLFSGSFSSVSRPIG
jgi:hypothetical protein